MSDQKSKQDEIRLEIERTKNVMKDNIDKTLQRGDQLDQLDNKAERLNAHAATFQKKTKQVQRRMWCKSVKTTIFLLVLLGSIAAFLIWFFIYN